jgi:ribosomal protein L32
MPVPKKRTSKSSKGQRRSHDSLKSTQLILEKTSGARVPRKLVKAAKLGVVRIKEV